MSPEIRDHRGTWRPVVASPNDSDECARMWRKQWAKRSIGSVWILWILLIGFFGVFIGLQSLMRTIGWGSIRVYTVVIALLTAVVYLAHRVEKRCEPSSPLSIDTIRLEHHHCPACGYNLRNLPTEPDHCTLCPECGAAWRLPVGATASPSASPF